MSKITVDKNAIRAKLRDGVRSAVYSEAAVIKPQDFIKELMKVSTDQRQKTIMALMGVDSSWSRVELYKTNGHVTQLQKWIMDEVGDDLEAFIKAEARRVFVEGQSETRDILKQIVAAQVRDMCGDYKIRKMVDEIVSEYTQNIGRELLQEIVAEVLPTEVTETVQP